MLCSVLLCSVEKCGVVVVVVVVVACIFVVVACCSVISVVHCNVV